MSEIQTNPDGLSREVALAQCNLDSPKIVVPYIITADDIIAGFRFTRKKSVWVEVWLWNLGIVILSVGAFSSWFTEPLPTGVALATMAGVTFLVCLISATGVFARMKNKEDGIRKEFKKTPPEKLPRGFFVLSPEGYAVILPNRAESWRWPAVRDIFSWEERLFVVNDRGEAHILASGMFDNQEEFNKFTALLTSYYNQSKNPSSTSPSSSSS